MCGCGLVLTQARDGAGHTPLFWASKGGHTEMVDLLLSRGAHINAQDKKEVRRPPEGGGWRVIGLGTAVASRSRMLHGTPCRTAPCAT